jgi:hypothetical protein
MDTRTFFLEQYDTVRAIVNDMFLRGLDDDQLRHQPKEGLNSIAWYLWHTSRWQDFANTLIQENRPQILDDSWIARLNVSRRDVGTGMAREECTTFNQSVDVAALKAYWDAVGDAVRAVARSVPTEELSAPVDVSRLHRMKDDGTLANERALWLPSFLEGKNKAWFLSMAVWHTAEHLLGGVVCVRRVSGVPLGI